MKAGLRLLAAGLAAAFSSWPAQAQTPSLVDAVPSITVEGSAKRDVTPDLAIATLGVDTMRPDAAQAAGDNAKSAASLVAAARQAGLADPDITTSEVRLAAVTDARRTNQIKAFRASNHVTLKVHDLRKLPALLGALVAQGANAIEGVEFAVEDPRPVLDELRTKATQNAADAARIYAKAAGVTLGRILRIAPENAAPAPMPRAFKLQMEDAAPPMEPGTQTIEARVQVTWELVP